MPVLILHSDGDSLFPVSMAEELHAAARRARVQSELQVMHGYAHDAPYRLVPEDYWAELVTFIQRTAGSRQG
jgi:dipeptidyl aminopeptidase/acylaminoacyl peptidase